MFGLSGDDWHLRRHRIFESNVSLWPPASCHHQPGAAMAVFGHPGGSSKRDPRARFGSFAEWKVAMGIDWMNATELAEAIPPAYTEWIGHSLIAYLSRNVGVDDPTPRQYEGDWDDKATTDVDDRGSGPDQYPTILRDSTGKVVDVG